jgi:hypothetical protein
MRKSLPPKIENFPASKQRRLDQLLEKNSEGMITPREKAILERLVAEAESLMVANSKRLARFSRSEATRMPVRAEPVTVWIQPSPRH